MNQFENSFSRWRKFACWLPLIVLSCGGEESAATSGAARSTSKAPAPVEVGEVSRGPITLRRVFSGTLEASSEVHLAPRVAGLLESIAVDLGDPVERGQVIARIDDDEWVLAESQAVADLAVAKANAAEAEANAGFTRRTLERREALGAQGITSVSELEALRAEGAAADAVVAVAQARVRRAEAALEGARLHLSQSQVVAEWMEAPVTGQEDATRPPSVRWVSNRFTDEGRFVSAGTPIASVVQLDPIVAVVTVPERDYAHLAKGQSAKITTDAYSGDSFQGVVSRIAPVFSRATRQVRAEIEIDNPDLRLKPGMFVRAELELAREANATRVPFAALTKRSEETGVFVLDAQRKNVRWAAVETGIREGGLIQIVSPELSGQVVTLGHEMCDDGSPVLIPEQPSSTP